MHTTTHTLLTYLDQQRCNEGHKRHNVNFYGHNAAWAGEEVQEVCVLQHAFIQVVQAAKDNLRSEVNTHTVIHAGAL